MPDEAVVILDSDVAGVEPPANVLTSCVQRRLRRCGVGAYGARVAALRPPRATRADAAALLVHGHITSWGTPAEIDEAIRSAYLGGWPAQV